MFFDTDIGGVVHNIAYLRMIETARTRLAAQMGMKLRDMASTQIYPVVIRTEIALVKFCSSAAWTYDVDAGDQVTITATIKRLDVWRERKQTVVVRPKLVDRTPAQAIAS